MQKHLSGTSVEFREGDADPHNYRVAFDKIVDRRGFRVDRTVQTADDVRSGTYAVRDLR